jgi:hypothetical protein
MSDPVIDWLLEADNPSVRYLTLTTLLGKTARSRAVKTAREAIMSEGLVPKILALQSDDGSWGVPEDFYRLKYKGTAWNLIILAELAADPAEPRIRKACEFILDHSREPDCGGFSYQASSRTGTGLPSGIIPCLTGNMVWSLIKLGMLADERVQQAIDWITTCQRADDGSEERPTGPAYDHYRMCWGRHSCHMGVAKTLKALAAIPPGQRSPAVNGKLTELTEYFLKHHLYKKSHNLAEVSRPGWLKLGFPLMYQTDILELLEIFAALQISDPRLDDAIDILMQKQQADGRWILQSTMSDRMLVRFEKKGEPSKWLTLKARTVLKAYR